MLCSRADNLEQIRLQPSSSGFWFGCCVKFHWTLAQITIIKKVRSGGLGLEQRAEPAATTDYLCCGEGLSWWWVGGAAVETLFIKVSGLLWCVRLAVVSDWNQRNLRCRIRRNTAPHFGPRGDLTFCFRFCDENGLVLMLLFVSNKTRETRCLFCQPADGLSEQTAFMSRALDVFLHFASCAKLRRSKSSILFFMRGLIFLFLFHFPGHFRKTNVDSAKVRMTDDHDSQHKLCQSHLFREGLCF